MKKDESLKKKFPDELVSTWKAKHKKVLYKIIINFRENKKFIRERK